MGVEKSESKSSYFVENKETLFERVRILMKRIGLSEAALRCCECDWSGERGQGVEREARRSCGMVAGEGELSGMSTVMAYFTDRILYLQLY
jgi:hypothetical protein